MDISEKGKKRKYIKRYFYRGGNLALFILQTPNNYRKGKCELKIDHG